MSKKNLKKIIFSVFLLSIGFSGVLAGKLFVQLQPYFSAINLSKINGVPGTYSVISGSMEPVIKTGGLVFSVPLSQYKSGDVITFRVKGDKTKSFVTHRIAAIFYSEEDKQFHYYTKGDANNSIDGAQINKSQIMGKVILGLPYLGYAANSVKDPKMFILFVIVPATVIVYEELKYIKSEISKLFKRIRRKKDVSSAPFVLESNGVNKSFIIFPFIAILIIVSGISGAFFLDSDQSNNSTITANVSPSPTPSPHIVINEVFPQTGDANGKQQYIELFNNTSSPLDISGWSISAVGGSTDIPNTIPVSSPIPAGGFALLLGGQYNSPPANTSSSIVITMSTNRILGTGKTIDAAGDTIKLRDNTLPGAVIIDQMSFGNIASPVFSSPPPSPTITQSVHRIPNGIDTDTTIDWTSATPLTPGATN